MRESSLIRLAKKPNFDAQFSLNFAGAASNIPTLNRAARLVSLYS